ncbi:MAG: dihydropteroate synthase [Sphingomonadales bacterium]
MENSLPLKNLTDDTRLYLKPEGLGPKALGLSFPLAGGPLFFNAISIILAARGGRIYEGVYPLTSLDSLKAQLPENLNEKFDKQFSNLTSLRKPIGALSFEKPVLMGILNLTPDSFSDGGDYLKEDEAIARAKALFKEGADIVDVGGESTRPGATLVRGDEELKRLKPVLSGLTDLPGPVSIDTRKSEVMGQALKSGALLINDVSALTFDENSIKVAKNAPGIILMHAKGSPGDMQKSPKYGDVLLEVFDYLEGRILACEAAGIVRERLIVDPGVGFGKNLSHNLTVLKGLSMFQTLGVAVLAGVSRKRFIGEITGVENPKDRLAGSLSASLFALSQGAQIIRCHDTAEMRNAMDVYQTITSFS